MPRRRTPLEVPLRKGTSATSSGKFLGALEATDKAQSWPIYGHLGLFVGITPITSKGKGGVKSWRYQDRVKGGPKILLTLGRYGVGNMTFEAAIKDATWARDLCERGVDPRIDEIWATAPSRALTPEQEKAKLQALEPVEPGAPAKGTIAYIAEDFYRRHVLVKNAPSTAKAQRWYLDKYVLPLIGMLQPHEFTVDKADDFLAEMTKISNVNSNRIRALLSKMWNWSRRRHPHGVANPITGSEKALEVPRNIFLTVEQVRALGRVYRTSTDPNRHACILPLITGCRRGAVENLFIGTINTEERTIRFPPKTPGLKGCTVIFCCDAAMKLLPLIGPFKTEALQATWEKMRVAAGLAVKGDSREEDPGQHDLRRTFSSMAIAPSHLNLKESIVDACISHSRGKIRDTYMVYTDEDLQAVAQKVGQYIWAIFMADETEAQESADHETLECAKKVSIASRVKVTEERQTSMRPIPVRRHR